MCAESSGDAYILENWKVGPAGKCVGTIEWVNEIYDIDWYEFYAVSVNSFDCGIAVGEEVVFYRLALFHKNLFPATGTVKLQNGGIATYQSLYR